jgi:phospholipid/cholesterol/gamma-HCH transport system permease protein
MQAQGMDRNDSKTGLLSWEQDQLTLALKGEWRKGRLPVTLDAVRSQARSAQAITLDARALTGWDSGLLTFLLGLKAFCHAEGIDLRLDGLPEGIRRLLALATPEITQSDADRTVTRPALLERAGDRAISTWQSALAWVAFIGEAAIGIGGVLTGRVRLRRSDLWTIMYTSGAQALPIVSLVSFLVGLILAFIGAVQLAVFGAQIYVASLVGISMVRVMGAVMVGVVMSGRTGAAFAARLGTMQVNEEIDALVTFGFSPFDFLVLPRLIALVVMMPLLCLYADFMGIVGGLTVGVFMFDLSVMEYIDMTRESVRLQDFWVGLVHSAVFGIIIALAGCLRGMQCGRSASAVGDAATSAVVTAIVGIIVATAVITVLADILGI